MIDSQDQSSYYSEDAPLTACFKFALSRQRLDHISHTHVVWAINFQTSSRYWENLTEPNHVPAANLTEPNGNRLIYKKFSQSRV